MQPQPRDMALVTCGNFDAPAAFVFENCTYRRNLLGQHEGQSTQRVDSFVLSGIFESEETGEGMPSEIRRVEPDGKVATGDPLIHFRNRSLDPHYHAAPVNVWLELDRGQAGPPARRVVQVALSGETFIRLPEEVR